MVQVVRRLLHTLPTTRHRCNLDVWALAQSRGDGHRSLVTPERVFSEYNEDLIFFNFWKNSGFLSNTSIFKVSPIFTYERLIACLHDQNKSGFFRGPALIM